MMNDKLAHNMKKTLALALALMLATAGFAQKFGFCNSNALLAELPEVKAADSDLKDFQTQLTKRGQEMVKTLQEKAAELEQKKDRGTISQNAACSEARSNTKSSSAAAIRVSLTADRGGHSPKARSRGAECPSQCIGGALFACSRGWLCRWPRVGRAT